MKLLLTITVVFLLLVACKKASETPVECYRCYVNYRVPMTYAYDTCVVQGQKPWRDDGFNCY